MFSKDKIEALDNEDGLISRKNRFKEKIPFLVLGIISNSFVVYIGDYVLYPFIIW